MRLRVLLLTLALLLAAALPASAGSDDPWVFEGGGWGHGVGLSQFGVLGQAQEERSVEEILQHYYTDVLVDSIPADHWTNNSDGLWVGILQNQTSRAFRALGGPIDVCVFDDDDQTCDFDLSLSDTDLLTVKVVGTDPLRCEVGVEGGDPPVEGKCEVDITWAEAPTDRRVRVNGTEYARGSIRVRPNDGGAFHVVVVLSLEKYVYGLAEVPSSWPETALQVQAISGRSYAVATAAQRGGFGGSGKLGGCGCHLWSTTLDQAYVGWSKEDPNNGGTSWKAAVDKTAGDVITHPDSKYELKIAKAFYSSSNGGASENNEDAWGGAALPWLRSVEDTWSADPDVNPLATWSVKVSDQDMATYFGWDRALDAVILQGPPGVLVKFTGVSNGAAVSKTLNGTQIRSLLNTHGFGYNAPGSTSTAVRVSPYITSVIDPPGFDDIVGHTFEADIEWAAEEGVTKGCNPPDNSLFCPNESVTRGQMAAFLNRYLNLPAASKDYFDDDNGSIFENDINRLAEAGITKGCNPPDNDEFCPTDHVTRQQMAAFLVRAFELSDNTHAGFDDVPESNTFFNDIGRLATAGITKGCNPPANTNYCPKEDVTRGQMTAFLHRAEQN